METIYDFSTSYRSILKRYSFIIFNIYYGIGNGLNYGFVYCGEGCGYGYSQMNRNFTYGVGFGSYDYGYHNGSFSRGCG